MTFKDQQHSQNKIIGNLFLILSERGRKKESSAAILQHTMAAHKLCFYQRIFPIIEHGVKIETQDNSSLFGVIINHVSPNNKTGLPCAINYLL